MFYFLGTGVENKPILIGHSEYVDGKLLHSNLLDITTNIDLLDKFNNEGLNPSIFVPRGIDMKPLVTLGADSIVTKQGGVFNNISMDLTLLLANCTNQIYVLDQFEPFFLNTFAQVMEPDYMENKDNVILSQAMFAACSAWNIMKNNNQPLDVIKTINISELITATWGVPLEGKVLDLISAIFDMLVTYGLLSNEPNLIEIEKPFVTDSKYVSDLYISPLIRFNEVLTRESYLANNESKVSGEDINSEVYHTVPSVELLNSIRRSIDLGEPYSADLFPSIFEFYPKSMLDGFVAYNDYLLYKELAKNNGLPITYITGQAEANDKDIRDNEKRYYNALMELQTLAGQKSSAYLANVTWYFETFIEYLICVTRGHTGWAGTPENFIASLFEDDIDSLDEDNIDEENNNDNKDTQEIGQFYTVSRSRFGAQTATTKNIIGIIKQEFLKGTEDIYVQAIIRLMRWGVYKPKAMKLPKLGKYVSFETGRVSESSGILKDTDLKVVNGKSYELVGEILSYNKFSDDNYVMEKDAIGSLDFPVGYLFTQTYNTSDIVVTAFSCLDIVKMLEKGDNLFIGVELNPNTLEIKVNNDRELTQATLDSVLVNPIIEEGRFKIYGLEELDEYVLKNAGTIGVATSSLGVLQTAIDSIDLGGFISNNAFASKQELEDKVSRNGTSVNLHLQANVMKNMIPNFLKVNTQLDEDTVNPNDISSILNHYYTGFVGKGLVPTDLTATVSEQNIEATIEKLNNFNVNAVTSTEPKDVLVKPFSGKGIKGAVLVYTVDTTIGVSGLVPGKNVLYIVYETENSRIIMEPTEKFIKPVFNLVKKLKGTPNEGKFKVTITDVNKVMASVKDQLDRIKAGDVDGMRYVFNSDKEYDSFLSLYR